MNNLENNCWFSQTKNRKYPSSYFLRLNNLTKTWR